MLRRRPGWVAVVGLVVVAQATVAACGQAARPVTVSPTSARPTAPAPASTVAGGSHLSTTAPADRSVRERHADWRGRRVLLVGDSLMFQAFDSINYLLAQHGVQTRYVGYSGTGLLSGQGWWLRETTRAVDRFRPDVVVIEACCNYGDLGPLYHDLDGQEVPPDSEAMFAHWAAAARSAAERSGARGAKVFWVVTPDAGYLVTRNIQTRIHRFNAISARLGVGRIDWRAALEPGGTFTTSMRTPWGFAVVRKDDDLHLTADGNAVVAEATVAAIQPALR